MLNPEGGCGWCAWAWGRALTGCSLSPHSTHEAAAAELKQAGADLETINSCIDNSKLKIHKWNVALKKQSTPLFLLFFLVL